MDPDGQRYNQNPTAASADRFRVMEGVAHGLGDPHRAGYTHCGLHLGNMLVNMKETHTGKLSDPLTSPVGFQKSVLLRVLSPLGFHFDTLPAPSVLEDLPIRTSDVMRVLGWHPSSSPLTPTA